MSQRKLKQLCPDYATYENLHNDKIFIMAIKRQMNHDPTRTQLKFQKKCIIEYFQTYYPNVAKEMSEGEWKNVAKRFSSIWQAEKNVRPALYQFRDKLPNLFGDSKQKSQASINFGKEFEIYGNDPLPVEQHIGIPVQGKIQYEEPINDRAPAPRTRLNDLDALDLMDRYFDKAKEVQVTLKDATTIQFKN